MLNVRCVYLLRSVIFPGSFANGIISQLSGAVKWHMSRSIFYRDIGVSVFFVIIYTGKVVEV